MNLSNSQLEKLSRRIRKGQASKDDLIKVEQYRDGKLEFFYKNMLNISLVLNNDGHQFLIAGRPKRTKSIIRKLKRSTTKLNQIIDLMGVRIIVDGITNQDSVLECLNSNFEIKQVLDRRCEVDGYRALHLYLIDDDNELEIQVRTLPQHLWAVESESFGEQVKERNFIGKENVEQYLSSLNRRCLEMDLGDMSSYELNVNELAVERGAILGRFPRLESNFRKAVLDFKVDSKVFLVIYDRNTNEQLKLFSYDLSCDDDKELAIKDFSMYSRKLDEDVFDVLFLNSNNITSLQVTHSIFFP